MHLSPCNVYGIGTEELVPIETHYHDGHPLGSRATWSPLCSWAPSRAEHVFEVPGVGSPDGGEECSDAATGRHHFVQRFAPVTRWPPLREIWRTPEVEVGQEGGGEVPHTGKVSVRAAPSVGRKLDVNDVVLAAVVATAYQQPAVSRQVDAAMAHPCRRLTALFHPRQVFPYRLGPLYGYVAVYQGCHRCDLHTGWWSSGGPQGAHYVTPRRRITGYHRVRWLRTPKRDNDASQKQRLVPLWGGRRFRGSRPNVQQE